MTEISAKKCRNDAFLSGFGRAEMRRLKDENQQRNVL